MPEPQNMKTGRDQLLQLLSPVVKSHVADVIEERLKGFHDRVRGRYLSDFNDLAHRTRNRKLSLREVASKGLRTGRTMLAKAIATYSANTDDVPTVSAIDVAKKHWPDDEAVHQALTTRAMVSVDPEAGGVTVREGFRDEWIDLLEPRVVVRNLRPEPTPMPEGSLTITKVTGDVSTYFVGEGQEMRTSRPTTGVVKLAARKMVTMVDYSNSLLRRAMASTSTNIEAFVQRRMIKSQATTEDVVSIMGPGTEHTPRGLINWALEGNKIQATTPLSFEDILADLGRLISLLEDQNIEIERGSFIGRPRIKNFLAFNGLNALGIPFFLEQLAAGELLGYPCGWTNSVPGNLGLGGDESFLVFVDMEKVFLGDTLDLQIDSSNVASYHDGTELRSAYGSDVTVMRAISEWDIRPEHDEAIAVLQGVTWGA